MNLKNSLKTVFHHAAVGGVVKRSAFHVIRYEINLRRRCRRTPQSGALKMSLLILS